MIISASDAEDSESDKTPLLSLIRHPETVANLAHALQGATDSPWTVQGQHQAGRLAQHIAKALRSEGSISPIQWNINADVVRAKGSHISPLLRPGRRPTHIFASPLGRTKRLAESIRDAFPDEDTAPEVVARPGLQERNFGLREGQIYSKGSAQAQSKPIVDPAIVATMKAETAEAFQKRVSAEAEALLEVLQDPNSTTPHVVVITHGLWIRSFLSITMGRVHLPFTHNTGIFTLGLIDSATRSAAGPRQSRFGLICQNDVSHLAGLKRQRGGIGSSAVDNRQKTLGQFWQASKRPKDEDSIGDVPRQFLVAEAESPSKKPKTSS